MLIQKTLTPLFQVTSNYLEARLSRTQQRKVSNQLINLKSLRTFKTNKSHQILRQLQRL